jgi:hypothetical protein
VYYRGEAAIDSAKGTVQVALPPYAAAVATDYTVQVTAILGQHDVAPRCYAAGRVTAEGTFAVFGPPGAFFWHVYGKRASVDVEPRKADTAVKGDGPYRWI